MSSYSKNYIKIESFSLSSQNVAVEDNINKQEVPTDEYEDMFDNIDDNVTVESNQALRYIAGYVVHKFKKRILFSEYLKRITTNEPLSAASLVICFFLLIGEG